MLFCEYMYVVRMIVYTTINIDMKHSNNMRTKNMCTKLCGRVIMFRFKAQREEKEIERAMEMNTKPKKLHQEVFSTVCKCTAIFTTFKSYTWKTKKKKKPEKLNGGMIMCAHIKPNANGKYRIISKVRIPDICYARTLSCVGYCGCNVQNVLCFFCWLYEFWEIGLSPYVCVCVRIICDRDMRKIVRSFDAQAQKKINETERWKKNVAWSTYCLSTCCLVLDNFHFLMFAFFSLLLFFFCRLCIFVRCHRFSFASQFLSIILFFSLSFFSHSSII